MLPSKKIKSALISVFHKDGIDEVARKLMERGVKIYSTGGTAKHLASLGVSVTEIEDLTGYPSILGGRVKTLYPKVFGGILGRRKNVEDKGEMGKYEIPEIDLVIVDLYPFEKTVADGASEEEIIEKIDIGGISLIRAAAKNFDDVLVISEQSQYAELSGILEKSETNLETRKSFAKRAFGVTSRYDTEIHKWFSGKRALRYGENPHQDAAFYGNLEELFEILYEGKELSYNNLVDVAAALRVIEEFEKPTFAILKHTNTCGLASRENVFDAWQNALACDPVSAFGGIVVTNRPLDTKTALAIGELFVEVVIAPEYESGALESLKSRKSIRVLKRTDVLLQNKESKTLLNGVLEQERDTKTESENDFTFVTEKKPTKEEIRDLIFANKATKHLKSNAIALVKNEQLVGMGCGQTSRIDALKQAIEKAKNFKFDLAGAVLASEAFFPFPDCVEIAGEAGITAIVQPGGSKNDQASFDMANEKGISMVTTGVRHFLH